MGTKNNFPWRFLWNFVLLFLAIVCCISQAVNGSMPGAVAFGYISYIIYKLMILEK